MYPVAAAITTGILLVGRPRPAIFLFLFVTPKCKLLCPRWEIKVKGFQPRNRLSFRLRRILDIVGVHKFPTWCSRQSPTKKIEENQSFLPRKFSSSEKDLQFRKSADRGRVVARTKLVDRLHNNNNNNKGQKRFWKVDDPSDTTKASTAQSKIGSSACGNTP